MKLVVGLGNPERKYHKTRHNVGFRVLERLAKRYGVGKPRAKFQGEVVEASIDSEKMLLLCPHTYMNNSGNSVQPAVDFYKLKMDELLVVCDDFNLSLGQLRFRAKGSAGGQKGLADIIRRLGSDQFSRLRVGIGSPPEHYDVSDFVLSHFSKSEAPEIEEAMGRSCDAVASWARHGIEYSMNQYN